VSSLVHYIVVLGGFLVAIAALGLDLTRITILAGAFGLGAGIGLQGAVANFVSGLILLLEGRIRVGDSVQMDSLEGEVCEIRGRASTIRTWDGAEVIVPNGRLTSENVINWTLSDRLHRVDVRVAVADASDPERVLKILRGVATAHPKILPEPALLVLCTGFADGAMTFELRAWTALFEDSLQVRSELVVGVHAALTAAHIEIAVPQRYIHLRDANGDPRVLLAASPGREPTPRAEAAGVQSEIDARR
jgi:potassium-dependent mechanosensitive channel